MTFCRSDHQTEGNDGSRGKPSINHLFKVDFGIGGHPRVADEVDDPFLALVWGKVEACGEIAFMWKECQSLL